MATERPLLRAVLDTNVIVAALKSRNPSSPNVELMRRWADGEFALLYSLDVRAEYTDSPYAARIILPRIDTNFHEMDKVPV